MANSLVQQGAQSATFVCPQVDSSNAVLTSTDWAKLPKGKLRDLLNRPYLKNVGLETETFDMEAFADAYAVAGGFTQTSRKVYETELNVLLGLLSTDYGFNLDEETGYPRLTLEGVSGDFIARISVSYSASE